MPIQRLGTQCTNGCPQGNEVVSAQTMKADIIRIRMPIARPFTCARTGVQYFALVDYDAGSTTFKLGPTPGLEVGDILYSDLFGATPGFATITGINPSVPNVQVDTPTQFYLHNNTSAVSICQQAAAAGLQADITLFNNDGPQVAGSGPIFGTPAQFLIDLQATHDQIVAAGLTPSIYTVENEPDGGNAVISAGPPPNHNGDSSTIFQYLEKLQLAIDLFQAPPISTPVSDGGTTTAGVALAYWFWLFYTQGDTVAADIFAQGIFLKAGITSVFQNDLPTTCEPAGADSVASFEGFIQGDVLTAVAPVTGAVLPLAVYNPTTGVVTLAVPLVTIHAGDAVVISNVTGTGAFAALNGTFTAGAGAGSHTFNVTIATGLTLTITGASVSDLTNGNSGLVSMVPVYGRGLPAGVGVLSQLTGTPGGAGTYTVAYSDQGGLPQPFSIDTNQIFLSQNAVSTGKCYRIQRVTELMAGYKVNGQSRGNAHWYQLGPMVALLMYQWYAEQLGLPLMFNEFGVYSNSSADLVLMLEAASSFDPFEVIYWNQNSGGGGTQSCQPLQNLAGAIQNVGEAFLSYHANSSPLPLGWPPLPLPLVC